VLGRLSDHPRRASRFATFAVTPVVVAVDGDIALTLDPREVADARWVTLSRLPSLRGRMLWWYRPWRAVPVALPMLLPRWRWEDLTIWGLTHGIVSELLERLAAR
jgi:isopentenyldiphosphate isomerase